MVNTSQRASAPSAVVLVLLAVSGVALAAETEEKRWSGDVTLASDYRFRGVSQSWREPVLQGHVQYEHPGGWYCGVWGSQVSGNVYPGASVEVDFYAGYEGEVAKRIGYDVGLIRYVHPGAQAQTEPGSPAERFDGIVGYLDVTWRDFGIKYWRGLSGGARDSNYLEVHADFELGDGWGLGLHAGRQMVRDNRASEYSDWRVSVSKELGKWTLGAAYSNTDADRELYSVADGSGTRIRQLAGPAWVAWISRSF